MIFQMTYLYLKENLDFSFCVEILETCVRVPRISHV